MKKFLISKSSLLNCFYIFFSSLLFVRLFQQIRAGYSKESWQVTEYLINYQGGFVRRGLLGEFIFILHHSFGIHPYYIIIGISLISLFALIGFFARNFIRNGYTLFFLPFVFFLGNPIIQNFWVRKDTLIVIIFILTLYLVGKGSKVYIILANLFLMIGLLIHEAIGFFSFPILFLSLNSKISKCENIKSWAQSLLLTSFYLIPSILTFLSVLYFKGSNRVSQEIWNSWKSVQFPFQSDVDVNVPAAIDGLSWSLQEGLRYSAHTLRNFNDGIYAPIGWFIIILIIYYILTNTDKLNINILNYKPHNFINKENISSILVIQFISIIPLFILGWDYSRWLFFWTTTSFAIIILIPEKDLSNFIPKIFSILGHRLNLTLNFFLHRSYIFLLCLLIGFPAHSWSFISTINTNSVTIVLKFISKIIEKIFDFLGMIFL